MKHLLNPKNLPAVTLFLSAAAMLLRWLAYLFAVDHKGLLITWHPLMVLLWLVCAAAAVLIVTTVWKLDGSRRYSHNFRPSIPAALGAVILALGILLTVFTSDAYYGLSRVRDMLGYVAASVLTLVAVNRIRGTKPPFLLHTLVCAFFAVHMVSRYRLWSGQPQLLDYFFDMTACVCLLLFAFYQASFEVGMGKRRMQLATGLIGTFACFAALAYTEFPLIYGCGGIWTITNLCTLNPVPRRKKAAPEAPQE